MADSPISPVRFERDLRAEHIQWKRSKDHAAKWAGGSRPSSGVKVDIVTGQAVTGSDRQKQLIRPRRAIPEHQKKQQSLIRRELEKSDHKLVSREYQKSEELHKKEHNLVKLRGQVHMPSNRVTTKIYARHEISDVANISRSLADISAPTSPVTRRPNAEEENFFYSFDQLTTPGYPVTLDIFVKSTGRDTEKLVEKEYEVINTNGESLTGRKARRDLRKGHSDPGTKLGGEEVIEDEGFELV